MRELIKHFSRGNDGAWTCVSSCEFDGPTGRIQVTAGSRFMPGTIFMGFDLVRWMIEHEENHGSTVPISQACDSDEAAIADMIETMLKTPNPETQRKLQAFLERRYLRVFGTPPQAI